MKNVALIGSNSKINRLIAKIICLRLTCYNLEELQKMKESEIESNYLRMVKIYNQSPIKHWEVRDLETSAQIIFANLLGKKNLSLEDLEKNKSTIYGQPSFVIPKIMKAMRESIAPTVWVDQMIPFSINNDLATVVINIANAQEKERLELVGFQTFYVIMPGEPLLTKIDNNRAYYIRYKPTLSETILSVEDCLNQAQ